MEDACFACLCKLLQTLAPLYKNFAPQMLSIQELESFSTPMLSMYKCKVFYNKIILFNNPTDRANGASFNVAKCRYMLLGNDKQLSQISETGNTKLEINEIKRVDKTKYLGLTIGASLSWNKKYKIVKGEMNRGLNSTRNPREILPQLFHKCFML